MPEEFRLDQVELTRIWTLFTEESDVKFFRQYVTSFVKSWEEQVSPNWELLVTSTMDGRRVEGPSLSGETARKNTHLIFFHVTKYSMNYTTPVCTHFQTFPTNSCLPCPSFCSLEKTRPSRELSS